MYTPAYIVKVEVVDIHGRLIMGSSCGMETRNKDEVILCAKIAAEVAFDNPLVRVK